MTHDAAKVEQIDHGVAVHDGAPPVALLQTAIDALDEIMVLVHDGEPPVIEYVSASLDRTLGVEGDVLRGVGAGAVRAAGQTPALLALRDLLLRHLRPDATSVHQGSWTGPTGRVHCLNISATPARNATGEWKHYWAIIARDVTQDQALTDRSAQAQRLESLGLIAGSIAHDFNNLAHAVTGFSELALKRLPASDPSVQFIQRAHDAAERASGLASQLLTFSRRQSIKAVHVNVRKLIDGLHPILDRLAGPMVRVRVQTAAGADEPVTRGPFVCADATQIEQVIINLVVNARDAQPDGGALDIELSRVTEHEKDFVRIDVRDHGPGMSLAVQQRAFEPFFTTKDRGTGLGLSTVHRIIVEAEGSITLQSPADGGLLVRVLLPESVPAEGEGD